MVLYDLESFLHRDCSRSLVGRHRGRWKRWSDKLKFWFDGSKVARIYLAVWDWEGGGVIIVHCHSVVRESARLQSTTWRQ